MLSRLNTVLVYLASALFRLIAEILGTLWAFLYQKLRHEPTPAEKLRDELWHAQSYTEWAEKAHELDLLLGNDAWKEQPISPFYDHTLIKFQLEKLRQASGDNDVTNKIFLLRSSLLRNLGGLNDPKLFERSYLGTKKLIEDYTREVVEQLEYIGSVDFNEFQEREKTVFFTDTRKSFGRTALVLYGGATFGLYHLGVCKSLHANGLLPRIISGTAIGALIAALVCIRTDEELPAIFRSGGINLRAFSKVGHKGNISRKFARFLKHGYLMDVKILEDCVKSNVGDLTFEEAYKKTKRILNITVSPSRRFEVPQLLNYLTAPNVLIWTAACASTAMLGLYDNVELLAKDNNGDIVPWAPSEIKWRKWMDSAPSESESPFQRITELFNVNHFIVSQANPYIVPFMPKEPMSTTGNILYKCVCFISSEFRHRILQLEHMRILPAILRGMVDEKVSGNVTIVPHLAFKDFKALFSNPTAEGLNYWILKGEQSTWPALAAIKNRCIIELALDRVFLKLQVASSERSSANQSISENGGGGGRKRTKSIT